MNNKVRGLTVDLAEDGKGADVDGGFGVEFDVAEDGFSDGVAVGSRKGDEEGLGEG